MKSGIVLGIAAYFLWGILPVYWKMIKEIPAGEILCHRIIWSLIFLMCLLTLRKKWGWIDAIRREPRRLAIFVLSAVLLSGNWFTYIWAVNHGFLVDASLGYFINPLGNVILGVVFLKERLRRSQWLAIGIAAVGVIYLTAGYGRFPAIAMILAFSFGLYGFIRKTASLGSLEGLTVEMAVVILPAAGYLAFIHSSGGGSFGHSAPLTTLLLVFTGVVTAMPLLLFAAAARRITMTLLGLLQYIAPTMQFLLGVFLYKEPFDLVRLSGFCIIWAALLIYSGEGIVHHYRSRHHPT